jgi:hypothetical protein
VVRSEGCRFTVASRLHAEGEDCCQLQPLSYSHSVGLAPPSQVTRYRTSPTLPDSAYAHAHACRLVRCRGFCRGLLDSPFTHARVDTLTTPLSRAWKAGPMQTKGVVTVPGIPPRQSGAPVTHAVQPRHSTYPPGVTMPRSYRRFLKSIRHPPSGRVCWQTVARTAVGTVQTRSHRSGHVTKPADLVRGYRATRTLGRVFRL